MSNRAVYIPPAKRKQLGQQPRFHGAFTGGFSAGHFNTVGTREGWTPSTEQRRQQTMEDFMDDQDVHEWGGPTSVRQDFTTTKDTSTEDRLRPVTAPPLDLLLQLAPRPLRAGPRLLRHLGWREGAGAAFVPSTAPAEAGTNDNHSQIHLSKRKLRQIQLQSSRVKILPPKLDRCGLGFEALEKAPEFQRYRQQRQELASARARGQSNVYRLSNLTGGGGGDRNEPSSSQGGHESAKGGEYLSYETVEDFVGTRSSSGFALRDDDDDAYDPTAMGGDRNDVKPFAKGSRLSQDYHNEIVDLDEDSDIDDEATPSLPKKAKTAFEQPSKHVNNVLAGALASWAGKNEPTKSNVKDQTAQALSGPLTSSGRPPLPGFRLGGSMESNKKRYPGPDLPRDYQLKPHQFGPNERLAILHTIGSAMQLEGKQKAREVQLAEQQQMKEIKRSELPSLGGNQFATLATAMRSRFTTATEQSTRDTDQTPQAGLSLPPKIQNKNQGDLQTKAQPGNSVLKPVTVKRSTQPFMPLPLVCKRFGVSLNRHIPRLAGIETDHKVTEASFFETEILGAVREAAVTSGTTAMASSDRKARDTTESIVEEPMAQVPRPSKEELKAIFEPESDGASSSSDDTDLDSLDGETSLVPKVSNGITSVGERDDKSVDKGVMIQYEARDVVPNARTSTNEKSQPDSAADSSDDSSSHRRDSKRKRSHKKRKKERKKSHTKRSSRDDDESSVDDLDGGKKERRRHRDHRKHSKKRRKKA